MLKKMNKLMDRKKEDQISFDMDDDEDIEVIKEEEKFKSNENNEVENEEEVSFDKIEVVKELPVQQLRYIKLEDGNIVKCLTIEEALTQLINKH